MPGTERHMQVKHYSGEPCECYGRENDRPVTLTAAINEATTRLAVALRESTTRYSWVGALTAAEGVRNDLIASAGYGIVEGAWPMNMIPAALDAAAAIYEADRDPALNT